VRRLPSRRHALPALVLVAAAVFTFLGCGGGEHQSRSRSVAWVDPDGARPYIGSLSVNPADGTLLLSSNTGLFRIEAKGGPRKLTGWLHTPSGDDGPISRSLVVR
jgi:hypothetical protein